MVEPLPFADFPLDKNPVRLDHLPNPAADGLIAGRDVVESIFAADDCRQVVQVSGIDDVIDDSKLFPVDIDQTAIFDPATQLKEVVDVEILASLPFSIASA